MPHDYPTLEDDIARLKIAIEDAKRLQEEFARLVKGMDKTLSRLNLNKTKNRPRRK